MTLLIVSQVFGYKQVFVLNYALSISFTVSRPVCWQIIRARLVMKGKRCSCVLNLKKNKKLAIYRLWLGMRHSCGWCKIYYHLPVRRKNLRNLLEAVDKFFQTEQLQNLCLDNELNYWLQILKLVLKNLK